MGMRSASAAARVVRRRVARAGIAASAVALAASLGGAAQASTTGPGGEPRIAATSLTRAVSFQAVLYGVSCKGRSFCMAVGTTTVPGHPSLPLVEEWNGKQWRPVPHPPPQPLVFVTCGSPSFCMALQEAGVQTLMAEWNGRIWHILKNQPQNQNVACVTATLCMAKGNYTEAGEAMAIQGWNGSQWLDLPGSNVCDGGPPGTDCGWDSFTCGNGPSCVGVSHACLTTDCQDGPFTSTAAYTAATGWDTAANLPFIPRGVGCAGRSFCLLTNGSTAVINQNADSRSTWQNVTPELAAACHGAPNCSLTGAILSCGFPGVCMAFPRYSTVTLVLNGATWTAAPLAPVFGQIPQLVAMSCGSVRNCAAVGSYQRTPRGPTLTTAEHWNGTTWQVTPTPGT